MEYLKSLMEKRNMPQLLLTIMFILYLTMGYNMPVSLASLIDTNVGKLLVVLGALSLFVYANPILGVLGVFVAYELIKRSGVVTGTVGLDIFSLGEEAKMSKFSAWNQFPYTLEQEMVKKMTDLKFNDYPQPSTFQPVLDNTYDASPLTDSN